MPKPITNDQWKVAIDAIVDGASEREAARRAGIAPTSIAYNRARVNEMVAAIRERREVRSVASDVIVSSLRQRVAKALVEHGPFEDVPALIAHLRSTGALAPLNDVVLCLWSLQKQAEATFRQARSTSQNGHGAHDGALHKIRATSALYARLGAVEPVVEPERRVVDRPIPEAGIVTPAETPIMPVGVDPTDHHVQPEEAPIVNLANPPEDPVPVEYPFLAMIRRKAADAEKTREAATYLERAADLLSGEDRDDLLERAAGLLELGLLPLEAEYLKYAEAHDAVAR